MYICLKKVTHNNYENINWRFGFFKMFLDFTGFKVHPILYLAIKWLDIASKT